ncbi:MAG: ABC transporter substrate-binding protein, partial [Chloroflexota bacterium]
GGTTVSGGTTASGGTTVSVSSGTVACDKPVAAASNGKVYRIGILLQNSIADLIAAIDGFKKGMEQCGFIEGKNVKYDLQNALGDPPSYAILGKKFADDRVDLINAVGSNALLNAYNTNKDIGTPIVFTGIASPYVAIQGVIKTETDHGTNLTGIQSLVLPEDVFKLMLEVNPKIKNIGLVYNPGEPNSKYVHDLAAEVAKKLNLNLVEASVTKSDEVLTAAQSIVDKVDAFYTTTDITVVNALPSMVKVATENKKPLFASNATSAQSGAAVAYGLLYTEVGIVGAGKAAQILDGKKPGDIPIDRLKQLYLYINLKAADQMGLKIPDAVLNRATAKYDTIKQ